VDVRAAWRAFWRWYERHYLLNVALAALLFMLQLLHLAWLGAEPISLRLTDASAFSPQGLLRYGLFLVDYTEIPALVAVSLVYVNDLRSGRSWRPLLLLLLLNSQWLHILWITDEYVAAELAGAGGAPALPPWLAWVAILIDYLELPVIYDTLRRLAVELRAAPRRGTHPAAFRRAAGPAAPRPGS
jgi:hypothetical protein